MSKVGILTFHSANNFGALLQAVSLQSVIKDKINGDCELINYEPSFIHKDYSINPFKSKHPKVILKKLLRISDINKRNMKFKDFRKKNITCSKKCKNQEIFNEICNSFDKIIVGSDQVWNYNLTGYDMNYFLPNISNSVEKFAYAASTGGADFSIKSSKDMIKCLQSFKSISVRENVSKDSIKKIIDKEIEVVLDPVFLTLKTEWLKLANSFSQKNYILFFKMGYSKTADPALEFAKKLSIKFGYELFMLWDQETWFSYRDVKHVGAVGPSEFLQWIRDAKCVVTNSFHATAFSIILNTPFYVETKIERSDRVLNILDIFDLNNCGLIKGNTVNSDLNLPIIDWEKVNYKLEIERNKSLDYINSILK